MINLFKKLLKEQISIEVEIAENKVIEDAVKENKFEEKRNALETLRAKKKKRKEFLKSQTNLSSILNQSPKTHFELQKDRINEIKSGDIPHELTKLVKLEKFNGYGTAANPFDISSHYSQSRLVGFNKKIYPIMYMTHVQQELSNFCVLNVKEQKDPMVEQKKIVFIDPAVDDLSKYGEYANIDRMHELASAKLPENTFISIDYPTDYSPKDQALFIQKSVENNRKYASNPQYICCIQSLLEDEEDFYKQYYKLEPIFKKQKKVIGIGAACSHVKAPNKYTDNIFQFLSKRAEDIYWVHFYGIGINLIREYFPLLQAKGLRVSFDSVKYCYAVNDQLKFKYGFTANEQTRPIFFYNYVKVLLNIPLKLIW